MSFRARVTTISMLVILAGAFTTLRPADALARMCGVANSCGTCCYGTPAQMEGCCLDNGCTRECHLQTSFCCPGGYQLYYCE
jgi:hypothetical protein